MLKLVLFIALLTVVNLSFAKQKELAAGRLELLSGIKKVKDEKQIWDKKFSSSGYIFGKAPAKFLAENAHYLIPEGHVLDVGMGEGRNAVYLARNGHKVIGVDISSVAVKKARALADEFGVRITGVVSSMDSYTPEKQFDSIICFYYVDRKLIPKLISWLRPGGILIFESHTDLQRNVKGHEHYNKDYLVRPGELLTLFKGMQILKFEEPMHLKEFTSSLIVMKPK